MKPLVRRGIQVRTEALNILRRRHIVEPKSFVEWIHRSRGHIPTPGKNMLVSPLDLHRKIEQRLHHFFHLRHERRRENLAVVYDPEASPLLTRLYQLCCLRRKVLEIDHRHRGLHLSSWISTNSTSSPRRPACSFQYATSFFKRATSLDETFLLGSFTMDRTLDAYLNNNTNGMLVVSIRHVLVPRGECTDHVPECREGLVDALSFLELIA
nr:hypothetical protein Iba_chr05eCG1270 [Ipomoea batatas]